MSAMRPVAPPRAPKPFGYVPLGDGTVARRDPLFTQGHDRVAPGSLGGWLEGRLVALTPLHVGTGTFERTARLLPALAAETPLLYPLVRMGNVPIVPGTTLKGALRAVAEAITASCLTVRGQATRLLPPPLHTLRPCTRRDALCPACRLFGGQGYLGRVRVADAPLVEGSTAIAHAPQRYAPRAGRGAPPPGRRFYGHGRPATGTVPIEVAPEGCAFAWRIDFANLQPAELGLLLIALGQGEPPLRFKLGGYKPACLGSAEFSVTALTVDDPATRYLSYVTDAGATPAPVQRAAEPAPHEPEAAEADLDRAEPEPADADPDRAEPDFGGAEADQSGPESSDAALTGDPVRAATGGALASYVQTAVESGMVLADRVERLAGILRYPSGRDCPGEGY
ncbi:MAG TPA: RAMP superfamily CRISPR-associated protein [Chloroflexota bacterium]|jgi:hypothetical protein